MLLQLYIYIYIYIHIIVNNLKFIIHTKQINMTTKIELVLNIIYKLRV